MTGSASSWAATPEERFATYRLPEIEVLLRVARTLSLNDADTEDLVHDTLIRADRAIDRFDGSDPRAWLLTILRNTQINRSWRRHPELLDDPDRTMARVADTSDSQSTEALVVGAAFDAVVGDAFRNMPDSFRRDCDCPSSRPPGAFLVEAFTEGVFGPAFINLVGAPVATRRPPRRRRAEAVAAGR